MADVSYTKPGDVPSDFWSAALRAAKSIGIDPYLIAAIGKHETSYGTQGAGREGYSLGYGYPGPGQGNPKYKDVPGSYDVQITAAAKQIKNYMGNIPVTAISLKDLQDNSWKPGDSNWANAVWKDYKSLNGNIDPVLNWGSDPTGAATDLKESLTSDAKGIASGVTYVVVLLAILGIAAFAANKTFSLKG